MLRPAVLSIALLMPYLVFGQSSDTEIHHHNIVFGVGPAVPTGSSTNYLSTAPFIRFGYGYRFNKLFQADFSFGMAFGAAHNQNPELTNFGTVYGGDHEFFVPSLGGRVYIPVPWNKVSIALGAGVTHLHYSETAPSGGGGYGYGYGGTGCLTCTSRGGWGGYGLGNISYYIDSGHIFHVGTNLEYIAGSTNGPQVANIPAVKVTDHWLNVAFEFGLSF